MDKVGGVYHSYRGRRHQGHIKRPKQWLTVASQRQCDVSPSKTVTNGDDDTVVGDVHVGNGHCVGSSEVEIAGGEEDDVETLCEDAKPASAEPSPKLNGRHAILSAHLINGDSDSTMELGISNYDSGRPNIKGRGHRLRSKSPERQVLTSHSQLKRNDSGSQAVTPSREFGHRTKVRPSRHTSDTSVSAQSDSSVNSPRLQNISRDPRARKVKVRAPGKSKDSSQVRLMVTPDGKRTLADRWGKMVHEYADSYVDNEQDGNYNNYSVSKSTPVLLDDNTQAVTYNTYDGSRKGQRSNNKGWTRLSSLNRKGSEKERSRSVSELQRNLISRHQSQQSSDGRGYLTSESAETHSRQEVTGAGRHRQHGIITEKNTGTKDSATHRTAHRENMRQQQVANFDSHGLVQTATDPISQHHIAMDTKGHHSGNVKSESVERTVTATRQQVIQRTQTLPVATGYENLHLANAGYENVMSDQITAEQQRKNSSTAAPIVTTQIHATEGLDHGYENHHSLNRSSQQAIQKSSESSDTSKTRSKKIAGSSSGDHKIKETTRKRHLKKKESRHIEDKAVDLIDDVIERAIDFFSGPPRRRRVKQNGKVKQNVVGASHSSVSLHPGGINVGSADQSQVQTIVDQRSNVQESHSDTVTKHVRHHPPGRSPPKSRQAGWAVGSMPELQAITSHQENLESHEYSSRAARDEGRGRGVRRAARHTHRAMGSQDRRQYGSNYELSVGPLGTDVEEYNGVLSPVSSVFTESNKPYTYHSWDHRRNTLSSAASDSMGQGPNSTLPRERQQHHKPGYVSDSEFSTTLQIKSQGRDSRKENIAPGNSATLPQPGRVNPPTISKGTVTRVTYGSTEPKANDHHGKNSKLENLSLQLHQNTLETQQMALSGNSSPVYGQEVKLLRLDDTETPNMYHYQGKVKVSGPPFPPPLPRMAPATLSATVASPLVSPASRSMDNLKPSGKDGAVIMAGVAGQDRNHPVLTSPNGVIVSESEMSNDINPDVKMDAKQVLNFYVFNQLKPELEKATQDYMTREIDAIFDPYSDDDRERIHSERQKREPRHHVKDLPPAVEYGDPMELDETDYRRGTETELREYVIHHKQTQTTGDDTPTPPPRRKSKLVRQSIVQSKKPPSPKVKHREVTHYITSEREVEKLPPESPRQSENAAQTDFWEEIPVVRTHADTATSPLVQSESEMEETGEEEVRVVRMETTVTKPPTPPLKKRWNEISETVVTQTLPVPHITEMRQMERHEEFVNPPTPPPPSPGSEAREITIQKEEPKHGDFMETLNREYYHLAEPQVEETSQALEVVPKEEEQKDEDSEEEIIETMVVEEKEQRVAMAIFEEVEFSSKRTEGDRVVDQVGEDSWKIPAFWLPDKHEAVVDRRRQKMTRVKDKDSGAEHSRFSDKHSLLPALEMSMDAISGNMKPRITSDTAMDSHRHTRKAPEPPAKKQEVIKELEKDASKIKAVPSIPMQSSEGKSAQRYHEPDAEMKTSYQQVVNEVKKLGSIPRSKISLPNVPVRNFYANEDDQLPENLEQFDEVVNKLDQELPQDTRSRMSSTSGSGQQGSSKVTVRRTASKYEPGNVSFGKKSGKDFLKQAEEFYYDSSPNSANAPEGALQAAQTVAQQQQIETLDPDQVTHTKQSEPVLQTRIVKDKDGNLMKITELKHTLTKTVEYDSPDESRRDQRRSTSGGEEMQDNAYIDMNLVETISTNSSHQEDMTERHRPNSVKTNGYKGPEVLEEVTVTKKPYSYDICERSVKMHDLDNADNAKYLYDSRTKKLQKVIPNTRDRRYPFETMTTAL